VFAKSFAPTPLFSFAPRLTFTPFVVAAELNLTAAIRNENPMAVRQKLAVCWRDKRRTGDAQSYAGDDEGPHGITLLLETASSGFHVLLNAQPW
jgi:hypothetical protein